VTPGTRIPDGMLAVGIPARAVTTVVITFTGFRRRRGNAPDSGRGLDFLHDLQTNRRAIRFLRQDAARYPGLPYSKTAFPPIGIPRLVFVMTHN